MVGLLLPLRSCPQFGGRRLGRSKLAAAAAAAAANSATAAASAAAAAAAATADSATAAIATAAAAAAAAAVSASVDSGRRPDRAGRHTDSRARRGGRVVGAPAA